MSDLQRCEVERLNGSFMTLGPRQLVRCENRPEYIVRGHPVLFGHEDTEHEGSMSMCSHCFGVFRKVAKQKYTYVRITATKKGNRGSKNPRTA